MVQPRMTPPSAPGSAIRVEASVVGLGSGARGGVAGAQAASVTKSVNRLAQARTSRFYAHAGAVQESRTRSMAITLEHAGPTQGAGERS
jgi:hypothetical protein